LFSWRNESAVSSPLEMKKQHLRAISQGILQFGWQSLTCRVLIQLCKQEIPQELLQTAKRGVIPLSCRTTCYWFLISLTSFSDFQEICFSKEV